MEEKIKLQMDSGACNDGNKLAVEITEMEIENEAKRFFGWRSATKRYNSISNRVKGLGSSEYDRFILHLNISGY